MSAQPSQFDSHRFIKRLTNAGVSEEVAEILAEEHASRILPADVATKADLMAVQAATQSDIMAVQAATQSDIAAVQAATQSNIAAAQAATSADISAAEERIRSATSAEIAAAVAGFKDTVADYKTSTLKWMFGMMMAFTGLVITTVTALIVGLG